MTITLDGDALAWYIAIMLTLLVVLLFSMLSAARFAIGQLMPRLAKLDKALSRFGGDGGSGGGLGGIGDLLGGIFGGGKR